MNHPEPTHPRERLLFLGSGVLLLLMVVVGLAREQRWGTHFIHVYLEANNTNGLHSGEEVRISGVPVGQVRGLKLMPDAKVRVQLKVEHSKAQLIGPASTARLGQEGLVGERFIEISADPQATAQTIDGTTIPFRSPISLESTLEELSRTQRALQATLNNTTTLTGEDGAINTTLTDLNISSNRITQEDFRVLVRGLVKNSTLERLQVSILNMSQYINYWKYCPLYEGMVCCIKS